MRRTLAVLLGGLIALLAVLVVEAVLARRGDDEAYVNPSRTPMRFGDRGPRVTYLVLGDSTGAGRGAPYDAGIAVRTARALAAAPRRVTLVNLAVSGAMMADVAREQAARAAALKPDVVLISAGANDVTHLTSTGAVARSLAQVVDRLGPGVRIVVTASPDVGSTPRLAQPLRAVAGWRTGRINDAIFAVARRRGLTPAPIAAVTGPQFRADHSLFAADRFHPNARGYGRWLPPLERAREPALR